MPAQSVIVVGAGIAGLTCAYRLEQRGFHVVLLDANLNPGGVIAAERQNNFLFESGPQSFQLTPSIAALVKDLQLESQLQTANPKSPRYILRRGSLQKLPMSPPALLTSSFLSLRSRFTIASEPFRRTQPPLEEETIAAFARRKFGQEILEYLVAPFVSGIYAGDPEQLSLKAAFPSLDEWERQYGSVIRGAKKSRAASAAIDAQAASEKKPSGAPSLCSFDGGVSTLTGALAKSLGTNFMPAVSATKITTTQHGFSLTKRQHADGTVTVNQAPAIVLATPAYASAEILKSQSPALAAALSSIAYAPVVVASAGYLRQRVEHPIDGFGFLVPRSEKTRTLGTIFNSSLFPNRAPDGQVLLTSFLGGATDLDLIHFTDSEISRIAHEDNARILGISGPPSVTHVHKWPRALPQYNLGHGHIIETIRDLERKTPGLFFSGNYLEGPALGKCVENANKTADAVESYLNTQK